jgi:hypothetical protein
MQGNETVEQYEAWQMAIFDALEDKDETTGA